MSEEGETTTVLKVPVLCYSRVVGYLSPVSNWHRGKRQEFKERVPFDVKELLERPDLGE